MWFKVKPASVHNTFQIEVRRWIYALTWHNLPEDKRDIVPTGMIYVLVISQQLSY